MTLTIDEIQAESLLIAKKIDSICTELNLTYVLMWGSLIGAVRHKGFIPWDDDLDIAMPRPDYEKLRGYFKEHKDELYPLELFSQETRKDYPYMLPRVVNTNFKMMVDGEPYFGMGTFVDIYPFDGDDNGKHPFLHFKSCLYTTMLGMKSRKHFQPTFNRRTTILKRLLYTFSKLYSRNFLIRHLKKFGEKFDYETSLKIAVLTWADGGSIYSVNKNDLFETMRLSFEDTSFSVPKKYDMLLRLHYGDYMKLPPENERIGHHFYEIECR